MKRGIRRRKWRKEGECRGREEGGGGRSEEEEREREGAVYGNDRQD